MRLQEKPLPRLYVPQPYLPGAQLMLDEKQTHYTHHVMRMREDDALAVFNGEQGEWRATITHIGKKTMTLMVVAERAPMQAATDMWLAFSMIKNKSELVVEKATELGVSKILPFISQHAVVKKVNMEKLEAHAIEASEQCERHDVPIIEPQKNLGLLLAAWPKDRLLLYGDEAGSGASLNRLLAGLTVSPCGILIGPEGGFSSEEHRMLRSLKNAKAFGMGPRILRADTAAVSALACVQAQWGDWEKPPHFKGAC